MEKTKICSICKEEKIISEYSKKSSSRDGLQSFCKECANKKAEKYRNENGAKEKRKDYDKKRYEEKHEDILEQKKEYHIKNRETILIKKAEYRKSKKNLE